MRTRILLIGLLLLGILRQTTAQTITNYAFTTFSGSFTAISGGATTTWTGNTDDAVSTLIPLGFDFYYMGTRYTAIGATTNGWISLGSVAASYQYTNNLSSSGSPRPVIAPLWDDLDIAANSNVTYNTTGTAGSRVFTLQYLNVKWNYLAMGSVCSFQVKLYEGTGKIEFIYRSDFLGANSPSASIGITSAGTGSGNYLSVNNAGTAVSSTIESSITTKRTTGRLYAFTSPIPAAPTNLNFTGIGRTGMTLNWTDASSNETGFAIYRSTDGTNYTYVTKTAANATSAALTGLADGTTYYWRVYAVSEGALSTMISGTQATNCTPPAAPVVTSPVYYCQNATAAALTAAGSSLSWSMGSGAAGVAGGTGALTTPAYVDATYNNKRTNFTTTVNNVTITSIDYYIPSWQAVNGMVIGLFDNNGTLLATSTTTTTQTAGASPIAVTNAFSYTLATAGNYSIGVVAGLGNIGSDNPAFPMTEATGTINITGVTTPGSRCYNNIKFGGSSSTAPVPSTANAGTTTYYVTQTVNGCTSTPAAITVIVTAPNISQVPTGGLIARYTMNGNAQDATGNNTGTLQNVPSLTADRFGIANKAYSFNGNSQYISTANAYNNPGDFTISIWFKTNTTSGGKLIGFGREQTGTSGQFDRHIYMNNAGQLYFGIYNGIVYTVNSLASYNDNNWHQATATLSASSGMALYVDGVQVGANTTATAGEPYTGYWRIGYDNMNGWTSQPSNHYFTGLLDDALVYHRALSAGEVNTVFNMPDGAGNNGPACVGTPITLQAAAISGATFAWSGPGGFSSTQQNPSFAFTAGRAGTYTLQVTVNGCTAIAYTNVTAGTTGGQWTGNVSADWADANNWCSGVVPDAATNVVINASAVRMPVINGNALCNSLAVNAGASLTLQAAGVLSIAGTLTNAGTFTNNGTIVFNGASGQQTFSGINSFHNLTVNNPNGLLLPVATTINNQLLLTAGGINAANYNLTVKGNWTNNAGANAFQAGTSTVTFSGKKAQSIGGNFSTTFNNLVLADTANTVTLTNQVQIGGNLSVTTGTFDLAAYTANRLNNGGELTVANNATLRIGGTNTFPSNFATHTLVVASTVEYAGANQTVANQLYGNLVLSSAAGAVEKTLPSTPFTVVGNLTSMVGAGTSLSFTAAAPVTVNGNVTIGTSTAFNGGSYVHTLAGNWTNNGTFNGNTSTLTLTGAGATVSGNGTHNFHHLTIAGSLIQFANNQLNLSGNLATTTAGSFTQASGGTLRMAGAGTTISGTGIAPDNLVIDGTVTTAATVMVAGNLTVNGSLTATGGSITMSGAGKLIGGQGTKIFNLLTATGSINTAADLTIGGGLAVTGSFQASAGTATFTGSSTLSGIANLYNVTVNGTALKLSANATLGVGNALTVTAGTLDVASAMPNTVSFNGTGAQSVNAITYCHLATAGAGVKTAAGATRILHDILIGNGTTFQGGSFTHVLLGSWYNNGQFMAGTSTVEFQGPATAYVKGATTFYTLTSNTSLASTELILQSSVKATVVNMINGVIRTGADTLTITDTRTGEGIIWGNIRRSHGFVAGVDYAFRSPYNTIRFTAVNAVNTVIVTASEEPVTDFPFGGSVNQQYKINVPAGSYTATLRLDYDEDELNGHNEASMTLWRYTGSNWSLIGKTDNSTTLNYVEQSALTDINGRWTFSDQVNHVRWNGSVSTDWHTAANWTAIDGTPSVPPSANDVVDLGTEVFNHQPTISGNATAKNIYFGSAKAVTLTFTGSGALTVSGNVEGAWAGAATHTISVNGQTMNVNGDLYLSDGVAGHSINLQIGTGTVNVLESVKQSGDASITFNGAGKLQVLDDYLYSGGAFTAGTGTVVYSGSGNQQVAPVNYYHLQIDKPAGIATMDSAVQVGKDLLVASGELDINRNLQVVGNITIASNAILQNGSSIHVGGNWLRNGVYNSTGAAIYFNGSGHQTVNATTFNNMTVTKPVGSVLDLTGDLVINGDVTVNSGTLDLHTYYCNRSVQGGKATLGAAGTIILGANNPPDLFTIYDLAPTSTVIYDGADQMVGAPGIGFGNLVIRNAGQKTLASELLVYGDLTIENGASFMADSNTITLHGNWIDSGNFEPATSTVLFMGTAKSIAGSTAFYKATIIGSYTILNNVEFNELLHIVNTGSISGGAAVQVTMHGDLINSGVLYSLGTTTYTGTRVQTLRLVDAVTTVAVTVNFNGSVSPVLNSTTAPQFGYLNVNNTGGVNPSVGWTVLYALTVGPGASFNGGSSTHNLMGGLTNRGIITSTGLLNFAPASPVTIDLGTQFSSTGPGRVLFAGTGAITLAGDPDSLSSVTINNTNAAGITPPTGWNMARNLLIGPGAILHAGNHTYHLAGNLTNNGTLDKGQSTFVFNGTGHQDIVTPVALHHLRMEKATGVLSLHGNLAASGDLSFMKGNIETQQYLLTLASTSQVTGASQATGWVNGKLQKQVATGATVKQFEVGDSTNYTPVQVSFANVATAGSLTAYATVTDHPQISSSTINAAQSVNRFWTLFNQGIVFDQYKATFHFVGTDVDAGTVTGKLVAGRYGDGAWSYPAVGAVTATSVEALGLTTFADFQLGEMILLVKTWDGGAGTRNWSDAANWNRDGVPTANDEVELTRADTIEVDMAAVAKKLLINNAGLLLTVKDGRSLTMPGDLQLVAGTLNTEASFPAAGGAIHITGGTVGFTGNSTQTIPALAYHHLVSSGTGSRMLASDTIGISGSFAPGNNAYTITGSTIAYNSEGPQVVAAFGYNNLLLANGGEKTFAADTSRIAGAFHITGAATANAVTNEATLSYNGNAGQSVTAITYHNLDVASNGGTVVLPELSVNNHLSVTKGVLVLGDDATARTLHVYGDITVAAGATFKVAEASNTTHHLNLRGNIVNEGSFDLHPDANSAADMVFTNDGLQSISGNGAVSRFNKMLLNMGSTSSNYLEVSAAAFTAPDGFLTLQNGSFLLNSAAAHVKPFVADVPSAPYLVPASAGLWVHAGTIDPAAMNWTVAGHIRVSGGVLNMGAVGDNVVKPMATSLVEVNGGALNLASRIGNAGTAWSLLMKAGVLTVNTQGSTAAGIAPFEMDEAGSDFDVAGGTIVIRQSGGGAGGTLGYRNLSMNGPGFVGGTLQIGDEATPAAQSMEIVTLRPLYNLTVNSAQATAFLQSTNVAVSNDVAINAGTLDINDLTLKIGGNIANNGAFLAQEGTIELNGNAAQAIPAGAFTANLVRNLTINNEAGASLAGQLQISGILLAAAGNFNATGQLTLLSTATQTALIDGSGAGQVTGNVTMQRYVPAGFGYKYFSAPFQAAMVNEFADDINLGASFPVFYRYEENLASNGWINYSNTSGLLRVGEGYAANLGPASAPKTVDMTGVVNNGTISFPLLYNHNRTYTQGFNLVGNPYPSPIDWDAESGWSRTNIDNAVYYFNAGNTNQYTGTYSSYINGVSSDGTAGNVIAAMQGFFVHVSDGAYPVAASMSINNRARVNNLVPDFRRRSPLTLPLLRLSASFADERKPADHLVVYFDDADATKGFDKEMDALKLMNTDSLVPNLYAVAADKEKLSICAWTSLQDSSVIIPLALETKRRGWISFNLAKMERLPLGKEVYLYDAKTGVYHDIKAQPTYRVFLEGGEYTNRFFLVFGKQQVVTTPAAPAPGLYSVYAAGNRLYAKIAEVPGEKCQVMVTNMLGQVMLRKQLTGNGLHELGTGLGNGIYVVSIYAAQRSVFAKKIAIGN